MKLSASTFLLVSTLLGSFLAQDASAVSIGVNFSSGRGSDLSLGTLESVGVIAQDHFNNVTSNNGNTTNSASPTPGVLVNNLGNATSMTLTFTSPNSYSSIATSSTGNQQLLNGYLDTNPSVGNTAAVITLSAIPYSLYDLYVYVGSDNSSRTGFVGLGASDVNSPTNIYFQTADGGAGFDGTFTRATATTQAAAALSEYVLFQNLTTATLTFNATRVTNNVGIHGFQVVQVVPEPATVGLLALGALGLVARRRRVA